LHQRIRTGQQTHAENFHAQSGCYKGEPHGWRWEQHKGRENEEKSGWKQQAAGQPQGVSFNNWM
jgi:hypothetical protein